MPSFPKTLFFCLTIDNEQAQCRVKLKVSAFSSIGMCAKEWWVIEEREGYMHPSK